MPGHSITDTPVSYNSSFPRSHSSLFSNNKEKRQPQRRDQAVRVFDTSALFLAKRNRPTTA